MVNKYEPCPECGAKNYWERDAAEERVKQFAQAEVGEAREELTVQYGGEGVLDVAVRPKYLRDALAVMGGDEVRIEYTSFKHPVKVLDESDPGWTYVVMPVTRPNSSAA